MDGYIKLARCLLQKPIFQNEKLLKVWIWCLLKASHKEHTELVGLQKVTVMPGQFITGRYSGAKQLKMNPSTFWKYMLWLKDNQSLDIKGNSKYSLITVVNWGFYQIDHCKSDSKSDSNVTAKEQQRDTNKNDKNDKNDINIVPYGTIVNHFNSICVSLPKVEKLTDSRKRAINARWKQIGQNVDAFVEFFKRVEASDFLTGRVKEWSANFDWILKPQNFTKIIEGTYDNRRPVGQSGGKTRAQQSIEEFERLAMEFDRRNSNTIN